MAPPSLKNPTTNAPSSSTLWGTASNGAPIVQIGALQPYTDPNGVASPAETGIRVVDTAGKMIFDTVGIAQVMVSLGSVTNTGIGSSTAGTGAWQTITGTTVNITLSRQTFIYALSSVSLYDTLIGDSGYSLLGGVLVDGSQVDSYGPSVAPGTSGSIQPFVLATLAAGAHTLALGAKMTSGHNWEADYGYLYVFSLGA